MVFDRYVKDNKVHILYAQLSEATDRTNIKYLCPSPSNIRDMKFHTESKFRQVNFANMSLKYNVINYKGKLF